MSPTRANEEHKNLSISELISTPKNTENLPKRTSYPAVPVSPYPHSSSTTLPAGAYPHMIPLAGQPIGFYVPCYPMTERGSPNLPAGIDAREEFQKNMSQPKFPSLAQFAILPHPLPPPPSTPKRADNPIFLPQVVVPRFKPPPTTEPPEVNVASYSSPSRPFTCTEKNCEWAFTRQSDLRRHLRSHNPPQYNCPFWRKDPTCHKNGGSFNRLDVLKRHLKLVHFIPDKSVLNVDPENQRGWCSACHKMYPCNKHFIDHCFECADGPMPEQWREKSPAVVDSAGYSQESSKLRRDHPEKMGRRGKLRKGVRGKGKGEKVKEAVKEAVKEETKDEQPPLKKRRAEKTD